MMLNTDICLQFDISNPDCCTKQDRNNCRAGNGRQCPQSNNQETTDAIADFTGRRNNGNDIFYAAFSVGWQKAVENGRTGLKDLGACAPTKSPTQSPITPTASPTPRQPTVSPTPAPTTEACADKDCQYIADNNLCEGFEDLCPVACRVGSCGAAVLNVFEHGGVGGKN